MSPARAYAADIAAKIFRGSQAIGAIERPFTIGEFERLLWRAWNDGARRARAHILNIKPIDLSAAMNLPGVTQVIDAQEGLVKMRATVHHLRAGRAPCGLPGLPGKDWPAGNFWSGDWADVNCAACLRTREPFLDPKVGGKIMATALRAAASAGTIKTWPRTLRSSPKKKKRASARTSDTRKAKRSRTSRSGSRPSPRSRSSSKGR